MSKQAPTDQNLLHAALRIDQATMDKYWKLGYDDAEHKRHDMPYLNNFRRGIGDIRTAPLAHETVSWLWMQTPEMAAYMDGFKTRRDFLSDDEQAKLRDALYKVIPAGRKHLWFSGVLNILPSAGGYGGRIDRGSTPKDLEDVRVILKVGEHIYQPEQQPGDLRYETSEGENTVATPQVSTSSGTVSDNYGNSVNVSTTNYYTTFQTQKYFGYRGRFAVAFDLFDSSGTPRITPQDKDIEVIVVYGPSERHVHYNMEELLKLKS